MIKKIQVLSILALWVFAIGTAVGWHVHTRTSTTWYVSNTSSNGYTLGSDTNAGTSKSAPFLTNAKAMTVCSSGDVIVTNSGGTPYAENSGSGYLTLATVALTWETDPASQSVNGNAVIQPAIANGRGLQVNSSAYPQLLVQITIDGGGGTGNGIAIHSQTALTLQQCVIQNCSGVGLTSGSNSGTITLDRCVFKSSLAGSAALDIGATFTNYLVEGCTFLNSGVAIQSSASPNVGNFHVTTGSDSITPTTFAQGGSSGAIYLSNSGTVANIEIDHVIISGSGGLFIPHGSAITCTSALFHDSSVNSSTMSVPAISVAGDLICASIGVYGWTGSGNEQLIYLSSAQSSGLAMPPSGKSANNYTCTNNDAFNVLITGGNLSIGPGNVWSSGGSAPNVACVGNDGGSFIDASATTQSGSPVKVGDSTADTYVAQTFTTSALSSAGHCPWFNGFYLDLSRVGSPAFTISGFLYATSGGVPTGSPLDSSIQVVSASTVPVSGAWYYFTFRGAYPLSASSQYAIVIKVSSPGDASDYLAVSSGTSYSSTGQASTGNASSIWTAVSGVNLLFYATTNPFGISNFKVFGDSFIALNTNIEGMIVAGTGGGIVSNCLASGGSIAFGVKLTLARVTVCDCLANVQGPLHAFQAKGTNNVQFLQNTAVVNNSSADGFNFGSDNTTAVTVANPSFNQAPVIENNILVRTALSGPGELYQLFALSTNISSGNVSPVINNNCVYGITSATSDLYSTWASWQGAGFDTAGIYADPQLKNESNPTSPSMYVPSVQSPAANLGLNLTSMVPTDFSGNLFASNPWVGAYSLENWAITARAASNTTVYALVRNSANGQIWNNVIGRFENYSTLHLTSGAYTVFATEQGTNGQVYMASIPWKISAGDYLIDWHQLGGLEPSEADGLVTDPYSTVKLSWNGFSSITPLNLVPHQSHSSGL